MEPSHFAFDQAKKALAQAGERAGLAEGYL